MRIKIKPSRVLALAAVAAIAVTATACGGDDDGGTQGTTAASGTDAGSGTASSAGGDVALVAYSTPQEAYGSIIEAFKKTAAGKDVDVSESYGGSGDQSRAVEAGQP